MPQEPNYITVPAVIAKSDIPATAALHGHKNSFAIEVAGKRYPAGTIRFAHFAGAVDLADELYKGEYRYEAGEFKDDPAGDLKQLPNITGGSDGHAYI